MNNLWPTLRVPTHDHLQDNYRLARTHAHMPHYVGGTVTIGPKVKIMARIAEIASALPTGGKTPAANLANVSAWLSERYTVYDAAGRDCSSEFGL